MKFLDALLRHSKSNYLSDISIKSLTDRSSSVTPVSGGKGSAVWYFKYLSDTIWLGFSLKCSLEKPKFLVLIHFGLIGWGYKLYIKDGVLRNRPTLANRPTCIIIWPWLLTNPNHNHKKYLQWVKKWIWVLCCAYAQRMCRNDLWGRMDSQNRWM